MRVLFDTTFLVEVERGNADAVKLAKRLIELDAELWISTVTVSEIIVGSNLRRDRKKAIEKARQVLGQFDWMSLNADVAFKAGELIAYLIAEGKPVDYPDSVVAATFLHLNATYLVSENKRHYADLPQLKSKVHTITETLRQLEK
ncbi:MAG: type II toxin-antitoxin system VapC family toxin [Candidatus Altiarchaeota archaeon]